MFLRCWVSKQEVVEQTQNEVERAHVDLVVNVVGYQSAVHFLHADCSISEIVWRICKRFQIINHLIDQIVEWSILRIL